MAMKGYWRKISIFGEFTGSWGSDATGKEEGKAGRFAGE
jgi:hypothetical protein